MRIVYKSETGKPLSRKTLPSEIYFILPVPTGIDTIKYRDDVMQAFAEAVRAEHQGAELKMIDRTGLPAKGFTFEAGYRRRTLRVTSHLIGDLSGGVPGIGVRATYRDSSS
jgi:hypothetical protein